VKSFVIDATNQILYAVIRDKGLYAVPLTDITANDATKTNTKAESKYLVASFKSDSEGSVGEYVDVCQMVLDSTDGSVYFGLRAEEGSSEDIGSKTLESHDEKAGNYRIGGQCLRYSAEQRVIESILKTKA